MAANIWKADRGTFFYVAFAWVAIVAAVAGFSTTYWMPMARRTFAGPAIAHIHGLFLASWIALLTAQVHFARAKKIRVHQRLGNLSLPLALAMTLSGYAIGMFATRRDVANRVGDFPYSGLIGTVSGMTILLAFVGAAYATRKRPDWHKRFMLLATVAVLWPAWFRWRHFMPWVPWPDFWLGFVVSDSLIVIAAVRDRLKFGRVHPVYAWFGSALMAEQLFEILAFDSGPWRVVAKNLFDLLEKLGF